MSYTDRDYLGKLKFGERRNSIISTVEKDDVSARMATQENATHYNMTHKNRGRALIFNHEIFEVPGENLPSRRGTNLDAELIKETLENLNFEVLLYKDLEYDTLIQHVHNAAEFDHTDYDCFVMVVLSHGDNVDGENINDILYAYDKSYEVKELFTPFAAHLCTTLAGKPKLFFVQACSNKKFTQLDILNETVTDETGINTNYTIPSQTDFLFAYANIPGYYSWRHTIYGSPFMEALCEELNKNAYEKDLATILTFVNQKVAIGYESNSPQNNKYHQRKQMPCFTSKLTRLVQFNRKENSWTTLSRFFSNEEATSRSTDASATPYNMNHKYRGMALVFNHKHFDSGDLDTRTGTERDAKSITAALKNLNFDVKVYVDLKYAMLKQTLANAANYNHTDYDCFVICVLSHGDVDILYAYDQEYNVKELSAPFLPHLCPTLAGKPKLFFIQASRGREFMGRTILNQTETDGTIKTNYTIPSHSDFLFVYSDIPGYCLTQNESARGSSFIKALCIELNENAFKQDIIKILTSVNRRVAIDYSYYALADTAKHQQKPVSFFKSLLTRLVQFNKKSEYHIVNTINNQEMT